MQYKIAEGV